MDQQQNINSGSTDLYTMDFELSLVSAEVRSEIIHDSCTHTHNTGCLTSIIAAQILLRKDAASVGGLIFDRQER